MTVDPPRLISCAEAKALGLKRYFTGKPCKHGHVAERWVGDHAYKIRSRLAAKRAADPQKHRGYMRRWRAANRDKINKRRAARRKAARASD